MLIHLLIGLVFAATIVPTLPNDYFWGILSILFVVLGVLTMLISFIVAICGLV